MNKSTTADENKLNENVSTEIENDGCGNAYYYFTEYCQNTSIHGLKYLSDFSKRFLFERLWWLVSISLSLYLCITLIKKTYTKWENSPVIVSFATTETPIWQIPFPAVTICPETKSVPSKFNYTEFLKLKKANKILQRDEEIKFGMVSLLCNYEKDIGIRFKYDGTAEDIFNFLDEIQPDFYKTISECKYMGEELNCTELFQPIFLDEGICYVFNLLGREEMFRNNVVQFKHYHRTPETNWSLEYGYPLTDGTYTYPRRALFAGANFALEAKLTTFEKDLDYICGSSIQGFKIQISHPSRLPRPKQQHFRIPLDQAIMAAMSLDMMSTSEAVKNYPPKRRNCYFSHERPLKYYQLYTQQNCQIECKTNYTLTKCGCVNYYMPRENQTRVCCGIDAHCLYDAEMEMLYEGIDNKLSTLRGESLKTDCDCLPICTKMAYIVENSQSDWKWENHYKKEKGKHMSYLQVFFKGNQFMTSDRNELFGPIDFLANLGGLLGLCIGFSLLSLIEIFYYLTLRLFCNIKMFGRKRWSGKSA